MSDKFLGYGQGSVNLTNGSATIFSATLGAAALTPSKPVKTNSVKQLVSANLDIPDINNLQTQLNEKDELTFVEDDTHNNPPSGKVKIYAKTDGGIYKLDSSGNETSLGGGGGGVSTSNPPVLDNALVFFDGTDGTQIKQINGIYYDSLNSSLQVDDLGTSATFSLNDDLQLISNIQSATQTPNVITDFAGEIHVAKIKSASHNTELEFETDGSATLTADGDITLFTANRDITLNGLNIALACPDTNLTFNGKNVRFLVQDGANTFGGVESGLSNTGLNNTSVGYHSLKDLTTGNYNAAFGASAGESLTEGEKNTFIGCTSGVLLTTGDNNTGIGWGSSSLNTTGNNNTSIGSGSLLSNSSGVDNTAVGYNCLYFSSGSSNTAVGKACMYKNTIGSANTAMGQGSLSENLNGSDNTFIGRDAGGVGTSIQQCVGIGAESGRQNTFGCVSVGWTAGRDSTGNYNTAIGSECLKSSTGESNTAVGKQSLINNTSGRLNTAIGSDAGQSNTTGNNNTCLGADSGTFNQTGSNNTFVGMGTSVSFGTNPSNSTSIGYGSEITASNQIVLGNNAITGIVSGSNGLCDLGSSSKKFNNIYGTSYHENGYSGSLIKNFPVGSNNTFSFITTPPDLTSGDNNSFYGLYAGDNVEISSGSTCIGVNAMRNSANAVDRGNNTCLGFNTGQGTFASTFKGCTMIGKDAGLLQTTGDNNTLIGYNASTQGGDKTNSIAIGFNANALNDNQCCIGNGSLEKIYNLGNGTCDLGAATRQFKDLYIAGTIYGSPYDLSFACTDEVNTITSTGQKMYLRAPRDFDVQRFKVSLNTAGGAGFALNIKKNGTNMINTVILGTTITTITPGTPVSVLENDEITVDVTNIGSGTGTGLKVYLIGKT